MDRTAAQIEADNALDSAVRAAAHAYEVVESGDVITSFVVVVGLLTDEDGVDGTLILHASGAQPNYVAVGLLRCGEANLLRSLRGDDE